MKSLTDFHHLIRYGFSFLFFATPGLILNAVEDDRPNILFFFADDWGRYASIYADLITHPTPIRTSQQK